MDTIEIRPDLPDFSQTEDGPESWADTQANKMAEDKALMAEYFAHHDFLRRLGESPEGNRETAATILVNQGTTPNTIVKRALYWLAENRLTERPPRTYFLTWFTPGHVVPTTLAHFRAQDRSKSLRSACRLFLFPGDVDEETQSVAGDHAVRFVANLQRNYTYALLSAHSLNLNTELGAVNFHFDKEIALQRECALRWADQKFLFLDSSKFSVAGAFGYSVAEMLQTAYAVTIYTVHSERDNDIIERIERLADSLGLKRGKEEATTNGGGKQLRLQIVGRAEAPSRLNVYSSTERDFWRTHARVTR